MNLNLQLLHTWFSEAISCCTALYLPCSTMLLSVYFFPLLWSLFIPEIQELLTQSPLPALWSFPCPLGILQCCTPTALVPCYRKSCVKWICKTWESSQHILFSSSQYLHFLIKKPKNLYFISSVFVTFIRKIDM